MSAPLKPPYPWFGGKARVAQLVWERLGNVGNYVEPFYGAGAVLLARPHAPGTETINDANAYVCNFWRALQQDPDAVARHADWPVNECVPAGTMIATPSGDMPVELVCEGMTVWGYEDGQAVPTQVTATKQNISDEPFLQVGSLLLTGNHPVWTSEDGYVDARHLSAGQHIRAITSYLPVIKTDLFMLQYKHGKQAVGDIHAVRPAHSAGSVCRRHLSGQNAVQRAFIKGDKGWQDASGLLDSVACKCGGFACLLCSGDWQGRRVARSRTKTNSLSPRILRLNKPYGRRRWNAGVRSIGRTSTENVLSPQGCEVSTGARFSHAGENTHTRSERKDSPIQRRSKTHRNVTCQVIRRPYGQGLEFRAKRKTAEVSHRQSSVRGTQSEDSRNNNQPKGGGLRQNRGRVCVYLRRGASVKRQRSICQSINPQGVPLQRPVSPVRIARLVYNFQTTTSNYFAGGVLVHNCDLSARHRWLVYGPGGEHVLRCKTDPEYFDPKTAGWWVWGQCAWIGSGWCDERSQLVDEGLWQQRPHLADAGLGLHRDGLSGDPLPQKFPYVTNDGVGVNRKSLAQKRPETGNDGRGVHRLTLAQQVPALDPGGRGAERATEEASGGLHGYLRALSERLRRVRVCCGDWSRVMGPTPTTKHGVTGIFLDPPYSESEREAVYAVETPGVAADVRAWCLANGDNPLLRVCLCGYESEHKALEAAGWTCIAWKASGGYGGQGKGRGRDNASRERLWFSPHCLKPGLFNTDDFTTGVIHE